MTERRATACTKCTPSHGDLADIERQIDTPRRPMDTPRRPIEITRRCFVDLGHRTVPLIWFSILKGLASSSGYSSKRVIRTLIYSFIYLLVVGVWIVRSHTSAGEVICRYFWLMFNVGGTGQNMTFSLQCSSVRAHQL